MFLGLCSVALVLLAFTVTARGVVSAGVSMLLIAVTGSLCLPALQTRLMESPVTRSPWPPPVSTPC